MHRIARTFFLAPGLSARLLRLTKESLVSHALPDEHAKLPLKSLV